MIHAFKPHQMNLVGLESNSSAQRPFHINSR
jgi:hypothetical protein